MIAVRMNPEKYSFSLELRVRNFEVDWQGIVHNANYLHYFEIGRIEYLKHLGIPVDMRSIQSDSKVVVVRNEIDYRSPAMFDELLEVHTRVSYIRSTSFAFEGMIFEERSGRRIAENLAIHVWLDPATDRPLRVPEDFRTSIREFEGKNVQFLAE
jgi:acyl-CoA thioester hydrolase